MEKLQHFATMGSLFKEEQLKTVDRFVFQNTLVLECQKPYPGYHGSYLPDNDDPDALYFVMDKPMSDEQILRISENLCEYQQIKIDATPAELFVRNSHLPSIRIRGLKNYSQISELQGCYIDKGIRFARMKKFDEPVRIRINKVFIVNRIDEQIYKDLEDDMMYYLMVPYCFNWNLFKKVTQNVKNNLENSNFDAAVGFVYLKTVSDFIRIYTTNPEVHRLTGIRNKYLEEIKRIQEK